MNRINNKRNGRFSLFPTQYQLATFFTLGLENFVRGHHHEN